MTVSEPPVELTMPNRAFLRRTAVVVGVLFIVATAFLFIGEFFYRPYLDAPDVLEIAAANKRAVVFGLLIEMICILAMPLIGAFIFPVLSKVSTGFALAYFFFRGLEAVVLISVGLTNKFAILSLSEAVAAGADRSAAELGLALIRSQNAWGNTDAPIYNIVFVCGAFCLYSVLFRARLIPRWISLWGLLAITLHGGLVILNAFAGTLPEWMFVLLFPIAVQEMVMAFWLIFRGFDPGHM